MKLLYEQYRRIYSKAVHGIMLLKNRHIDKHVVVFESDDWGSVRMPSVEVARMLQKKGCILALPESYDRVDTLASNDDLECLMEVLSSVKDVNGNPAKITLNTCVANPDFKKIKESGYQDYFYEPFTETLKRYPHHDRSFALWKEGIMHGVFKPQFHGREHLNPQKWLSYLQNGDKSLIAAFNEGCYSIGVPNTAGIDFFLEAYKIETPEDSDFVRKSIHEGLQLFEKLFGFKSESMIAPCYTWDSFVEDEAWQMGVNTIQGGYIQRHSPWQKKQGKQVTGHYFGEINQRGQCYLIRNSSFELSQIATDNAEKCFAQIKRAFERRLPAVISCHRLNFIGDLVKSNRDNNLRELNKLLNLIVHNYPDTIFMSSDELGAIYLKRNK